MGKYTYKIWFTNDPVFPWKWAVYLDDKLLTDHGILNHTGSAVFAWSAKWGAKRFIRRHRKYQGKTFNG